MTRSDYAARTPAEAARRRRHRESKARGVAHRRALLEAIKGSTLLRFSMALNSAPGMTRWFPGDIKPVRPGLYQVRIERAHEDIVEWCWFNGVRWGWSYRDKRSALSREWREADGASQDKPWRGLTAEAYFA